MSSSTPRDFQPNPVRGLTALPVMNRYAPVGPPGNGYIPVAMHSAFDSAIGLPSSSTNAAWMLTLLIPEEVRRSFVRQTLLPASLTNR